MLTSVKRILGCNGRLCIRLYLGGEWAPYVVGTWALHLSGTWQGTSNGQIGQHFSALENTKLRFVVQKAQQMLAEPTGGCKKLRETHIGAHKCSAQKRVLGSNLVL